MADVTINKFRASVVRDGSKPASPGFIVSEGQDPVNPPGTNNYVPYSGATANVELGEFGVEAGFVTLDTTPTNIPTDQGAIYWDDTRSTAALIMNGTLQHIGQDSFFYVKNSSGSTIPKGTCVGFAGTDGGSGHLLVTPFLANGSVPSTYFMGVTAEAIANGSFGQVMHFGELEGINTSGFTAGALLYASSTVAGAFQTTAPVAPNNIILVAAAVNSKNNGAIVVRPTYGSNINTDEGVKITSPTTGDLLQLQAGGLWENKTLAQVIGSAYVPSTRTITINGTTQDLSADRTFNVGDMLLGDIQTVTARKDFNSNTLQLVVNGTSQKTILTNSPIDTGSYSLAINAFGFNASNNLYFSKGGNNNGIFAFSNSATRTYTLKDASGTLAFTSDIPSLSGYVQGSGTTNYLPKFTGASTIGNSQIFDNGTNVGIGTATPNNLLTIIGNDPSQVSIEASSGNTNSQINLKPSGTGIAYIKNQANTGFAFGTNNTEAMRLSASLNLLVGTTTDNGARLQVSGAGNTAMSVGGNGYSVFTGSAFSYTPNNIGLSLGYNRSGGNGESSIVWGAPAAGFNFEIASVTSNVITPRMTITSSGNVGIGTSSPSYPLQVRRAGGAGSLGISIDSVGTTDRVAQYFAIQDNASGAGTGHAFYYRVPSSTTDVLGLFLNESGNVLIGTTSDNGARLQVSGTGVAFNFTTSNGLIGNINSSAANGGYITWQTSGTTIADLGTAQQVFGAGGSDTFGINARGARSLILGTNNTARLTITSGGNVLIGTTTDSGARLNVRGSASSYPVSIEADGSGNQLALTRSGAITEIFMGGTSSGATQLYVRSGGSGGVRLDAGSTGWVSASDIRLKDITKPIENAVESLFNLQTIYYSWKDWIDKNLHIGLIAQEVEKVFPELVSESSIDGMKGVNYTELIPVLIAAVKELKQEIDTLKN